MKRSLVVMAMSVGLSLFGCGGPTLEQEPAPEAGESGTVSQFATCTATCDVGMYVSCSGTSCSATDYQGVTCAGTFKSCDEATCSGLPSCSDFVGPLCSPIGATVYCCDGSIGAQAICTYWGSGMAKWRIHPRP